MRIIQTPPGTTLEHTNAKTHELQERAKEIPEVVSVSSLAGYEVLTEGRGSNAGTCIINLKNWSQAQADLGADHRLESSRKMQRHRQRQARVLRTPRSLGLAPPAGFFAGCSTRPT